jgi:hypothetical protein
MPRHDKTAATLLEEIERHVAWVYLTALQPWDEGARHPRATQDQQLLRQILHASEAFKKATSRLSDREHDPDEALDVALILGRALRHWNRAAAEWQSDARRTSLHAAAMELTHAGEALHSALAPPPSFPDEENHGTLPYVPLPRKVM